MQIHLKDLEKALIKRDADKVQDQIKKFNDVFEIDSEDGVLQESMQYVDQYVDKYNRVDKKVIRGAVN